MHFPVKTEIKMETGQKWWISSTNESMWMEMEKSQEIKSKTLLGEFWSIDLTMHLLEGAKNDFYTHS